MKEFDDHLKHGEVINLKNQEEVEKINIPPTPIEEMQPPPLPEGDIDSYVLKTIHQRLDVKNVIDSMSEHLSNYFDSLRSTVFYESQHLLENTDVLSFDVMAEKDSLKKAEEEKNLFYRNKTTYSNKNNHSLNIFEQTKLLLGFIFGFGFIFFGAMFATSLVIELNMLDIFEEKPHLAVANAIGAFIFATSIKYGFRSIFPTDKGKLRAKRSMMILMTITFIIWVFGFSFTHEAVTQEASVYNEENLNNLAFMAYVISHIILEVLGGAFILIISELEHLKSLKKVVGDNEDYIKRQNNYNKDYNNQRDAENNIAHAKNVIEAYKYSKLSFIKSGVALFNERLLEAETVSNQELIQWKKKSSPAKPKLNIVGS